MSNSPFDRLGERFADWLRDSFMDDTDAQDDLLEVVPQDRVFVNIVTSSRTFSAFIEHAIAHMNGDPSLTSRHEARRILALLDSLRAALVVVAEKGDDDDDDD